MNTKKNSCEPEYAVRDTPKIKTVGLRFDVGDHNLETKIKEAFALAKSAGRELDLAFGAGESKPNAVAQLHL